MITIADKYLTVLEHRGAPAKSREIATYSDDPYNMSRAEYVANKKRIKADYREKNRAAQKKLTQSALGALRRKPQKWLSYREQKKKELADIETKYRRSKIDRQYGNTPGAWREDERGKYPVGTQGKPRHQRAVNRPKQLPAPKYDYDAEYSTYEEPRGYLPPAPTPAPPSGYLPPAQQRPTYRPRRELPQPPKYPALPPPPPKPRPVGPALPPGRQPVRGLLPAGRVSKKVAKAAEKVKKRRGSRR
jgi:hypothetical protein